MFAVEGADVLFAHWPVPVAAIRERLPADLSVDTYDGSAWVTVLPHRISGLQLAGQHIPVGFPQLNVRTYVRHGDTQGVFFLDCETGDRFGAVIARRAFDIPFHRAEMRFDASGDRYTVRSHRARPGGDVRFDAHYRPTGKATTVESGSLAAFLIERTRWYVDDSPVRVGRIEREPWQVAPASATLRTNTLGQALDLPLSAAPTVHYSPGYGMDVRPLRRAKS
ncbi:YqjF family protein [Halosegnis sp.]|uniref:YqjF family protein n=1 Tax=Halosegnis sp. TaxID=2864959 RepID=UPI0035D413A8